MISKKVSDTHKYAAAVAKKVKKLPVLILLSGDLGAGKTEWVRGFTKAYLGKADLVSSPSYSLINLYEAGKKKIYHADLYRLKSTDDLESTGLWDILNEKAVILVEWPFVVTTSWPKEVPVIKVDLKILDESSRQIQLTNL